MYIERRKVGKNIKFYLVHSYRDKWKVKKIRKYLGKNLSKDKIKKESDIAKKSIKELMKKITTQIFNFSLTKNQIKKLNNYQKQIKIVHLDSIDWKNFTENFVYNTNAIEGSTIQLYEVKELLENKRYPKDKEELETKNVAEAVEFIRKTKEELSLDLIKKLHKICFKNSKDLAGRFRNVEVVIKNTNGDIVHTGVPFKELDIYLKKLISWYQKNKNIFKPLILAAIIHNQFEHIHPFQDGNGRVGRLLLNFILIKNKYPPINIALEDRKEYYKTLQDYSRKQDIISTLKFLIKQYNKTLKQVTTKQKE